MRTLALTTLIGLLMLATLGVPAQAEGEEVKGPKEAKAEAKKPKWLESRCVPTELTHLIQSAYGPSRELVDGREFAVGDHKLLVAVLPSKASETEAPVKGNKVAKPAKEEEAETLPLPKSEREFSDNFSISLNEPGKELWLVPTSGGAKTWVIGETKIEVSVYHDLLGRPYLQPRFAWKARPSRKDFLFIDQNFNGRFDDELVDSMVLGRRGRFAFPFSKKLPLDDGVYEFEFIEKNNLPYLRYNKSAFITKGSAKLLQVTLNRLRMNFGLFPASSDEEWNLHCLAHCKYMKKNDSFTHHEDPKKPGFTNRGHIAGVSGIMTKGNMSAVHALYSLWDTPLHAFDIRSPHFSHAAFGYMKPFSVIRSTGLTHRPFAFGKTWSFPPNGAVNIPIEWPAIEMPEPRTDIKRGKGYPITFYTNWGVTNFNQEDALNEPNQPKLKRISRPKITNAIASLAAWTGKEWKAAEIQHTFDQESAPKSLKHWAWVHHYILPQEKLLPFTRYRVELRWTNRAGEKKSFLSCFTTGQDRAGHEWKSSQSIAKPKNSK